ncbi:MAG: GNAT family N-acetyltransferase [Verrucomicrobiota bacterium]|nr:GNAT family N-acetyltransferase [Verrucomicrobiota bacterium]
MIWVAGLSLLCAAAPALLFLVNLRLYRPAPAAGRSTRRTSVLIPARDEEERIEQAVRAALQSGADEVLVLDDGSRDHTAEIVRRLAAEESRVRLLRGDPLPSGWCGKNFACAQLASAARKEILIFVDADVRLAPGSAPRLTAFLEKSGAQLASGVPREVTVTLSEQLLIPLIHFLLLGFLPLRRMRRSRHPAYGAGCGQLFVAEAEAYRTCGGHAAIRERIHEGLALPKKFREHGFTTDLFDATDSATCRMYQRDAEVWRGLAKNTHEGLGAPRVILPMTFLLLAGQVLPFFLLIAGGSGGVRWASVFACGFIFLPRLVAMRRFRHPWQGVILHPVAILGLLGIQWIGLLRFFLGRPAYWKGRAYPVRGAKYVVRRAEPTAPEVLELVGKLWSELGALYPELNASVLQPHDPPTPGCGFVVAWLKNAPVGCGAFRPISEDESEIAEIRRMFVLPQLRRNGVARTILVEIERLARTSGYSLVRLETGLRQPGAIRLYESSGYRRIEPFGRYRDDPLSVCFEKSLRN